MKTFPLNAWYAAAYDVEVKAALLSRTICGQKIVMFRRRDASVAALEDACWHRLLPLSKGRLHDDQITCGYHGLVFNGDGRCTHMPSQETLNPAACVRAFPVVEKHRFVWVWPGDPALADPAQVPDLHWNDDPAWAGDGKLITVKCDYRLVLDNLMDLTHETYVHGCSIGQLAVAEAPFVATHGDAHRHGDALDGGHRRAALLGRPAEARHRLRRPRRPLADHPLRGTLHHRHRRRRGPGRQRRGAEGRPARRPLARASMATC